MENTVRILLIAVAIGAVGACGGNTVATQAPTKAVVSLSARPAGEAAKIVLSLRGDVQRDYDLATLEKSDVVEASLYEPFEKKIVVFAGPLLHEILSSAGVASPGARIQVTALDDYTYTFTLAQLEESSVILASRQNGEPIPVDNGGPIRIVAPNGTPIAKNTDSWVWSVREARITS